MSDNNTALVTKQDSTLQLASATGFDVAVIQTARETVGRGLTDPEFALFLTVAARTGLDPFAKQIYAIKRRQRQPDGSYKEVMVLQTGIDGFRSIGARTDRYAGQEGPLWCGADGQWSDIWLSDDFPVAAKVGIYLRGSDKPVWGVVKWREFAPLDEKGRPSGLWHKMPDHMLAKCAEAQAWRKAFPYEMGALKAEEETTRDDAAANSLEALQQAGRDAAPLQIPKAASKRFMTPQLVEEPDAVVDAEPEEAEFDERELSTTEPEPPTKRDAILTWWADAVAKADATPIPREQWTPRCAKVRDAFLEPTGGTTKLLADVVEALSGKRLLTALSVQELRVLESLAHEGRIAGLAAVVVEG